MPSPCLERFTVVGPAKCTFLVVVGDKISYLFMYNGFGIILLLTFHCINNNNSTNLSYLFIYLSTIY